MVGKISSLADRLLARFVPKADAAAATAGFICGWAGCGYACLIRDYCCHTEGCHYGPCYWAC